MSAVSAAFSLTRLDRAWRVTSKRRAASVTGKPERVEDLAPDEAAEMGRVLHGHRLMSPSVIVHQVEIERVAVPRNERADANCG